MKYATNLIQKLEHKTETCLAAILCIFSEYTPFLKLQKVSCFENHN